MGRHAANGTERTAARDTMELQGVQRSMQVTERTEEVASGAHTGEGICGNDDQSMGGARSRVRSALVRTLRQCWVCARPKGDEDFRVVGHGITGVDVISKGEFE